MWTKELVELLLIKYQENENLFNVKHPDYMDRVKRANSLFRIYEELKPINSNVTVDAIKKKVHTLRSQYIKELREVASSKKSGVGTDDIYVPKLWCFDQMEFLKTHCAIRNSTSNTSSSDDHNENFANTDSIGVNSGNAGTSSKKRKTATSFGESITKVKNLLVKRLEDRSDYDWLGQQVVFEMKSIRSEEIRKDTAWKIQTILREATLKDRQKSGRSTTETNVSESLNESESSCFSTMSFRPISAASDNASTTYSQDPLEQSLVDVLDDEEYF